MLDVSVDLAGDLPAAVRRVLTAGSVLVVNSVRRLDLERLLAIARSRGASTVWYVRETSSLDHMAGCGAAADVLIANSPALASASSDLAGRPCAYVPSVISPDGLVEPAERSVLLAVHPAPSHGLDLLVSLARALPERRFVLQESRPLDAATIAGLHALLTDLPNIELRRRAHRSEIYRDSYAQLLPHTEAAVGLNRPRVALESQHLGIPVVASDIPGLAAVSASRDLLVPRGAGVEGWVTAIARLDADYGGYSSVARAFAAREMPTPCAIWDRFVQACAPLLDDR